MCNGDPDARTKMYAYNLSSNMLSKKWYVSPVDDKKIYRVGTGEPSAVCVDGLAKNGCAVVSWAYRCVVEMPVGELFISWVFPGACNLDSGFPQCVGLRHEQRKFVAPNMLGVFKWCDSWNLIRVGELVFSDPTSTTSSQIRRGFQ